MGGERACARTDAASSPIQLWSPGPKIGPICGPQDRKDQTKDQTILPLFPGDPLARCPMNAIIHRPMYHYPIQPSLHSFSLSLHPIRHAHRTIHPSLFFIPDPTSHHIIPIHPQRWPPIVRHDSGCCRPGNRVVFLHRPGHLDRQHALLHHSRHHHQPPRLPPRRARRPRARACGAPQREQFRPRRPRALAPHQF